MGCCHSHLQSKEAVSRCKARRRYMSELSEARQAFSIAHSLYLHFIRSAGSALLQFANAESHLHRSSPLSTIHSPPCHRPPSPLSPISDNWASSVTASPVLPPPPPPPPPLASCSWEFWDPFAPSSAHSVTEEEWEEAVTSISSANAATPELVSGFPKDPSVELAVVSVPRAKKNFSEIVEELNEYFSKASETGKRVSLVLETPICDSASPKRGISGKMSVYCKNFSPLIRPWSSSPKSSALASLRESGKGMSRASHSCTVEKLYAWEKKLYLEVKNCERSRVDKEKRMSLLRRQEANGVDYFKVEKNKREIERLESQLMVYCQAIESTSAEIAKLTEEELFPQLLDLASGLMSMWRGMYECHQVQTHIVQQLQHLNSSNPSSTFPTSELHRHNTQQLEAEIDNWHSAFCSLIKSQRDYIHAITGWLRLSHFQCQHGHRNRQNSQIYELCEEWQLALDRVPDKVASDGIKSFLTMIRTVVAQQAEEHKYKKRSDSAFKELEKRSKELRSREEKRARVEALKLKAEEERVKYEKSCGITRAKTLNNLQTGLPNLFQAMTGFSSVCTQAFSEVCNPQRKSNIAVNFDRMLLP